MIREKLQKIVNQASVDYIEARLETRKSTGVTYLGRELDELGEREASGGCVRACHKGGWGFCSFNLTEDLERAAREAADQARSTGSSVTALKAPAPVSGSFVQNFGEDPTGVSLEEKRDLANRYNNLILANPKIASSRVSYLDQSAHIAYVNNRGACIEQDRVFTGITMSAMARDGANVQRAYHSVGDHRGFANVRGLDATVEETVKRAMDLLSARKVEGGRYTVILDPKLSGVFAHEAFGHMSEADFIFENPRIAEKMRIGGVFGSPALNIVDNGSLLEECGGYPVDDEGVPSRKTYLIRQGVLSGHLHSMETAEKMGEGLTGNARAISYRFKPIVRMSCTYIEAGATPFEEMISGIKNGIYAVGMMGGNTDLEQFTFSAEHAFEIKDGKVGGLVRDVILTGNLFETLHNIDGFGNDLKFFGGMGGCGKEGQSPLPVSDGGPHLRIKNVLIG